MQDNMSDLGIMYVDDEEKSLKYFAREMGQHFKVYTATSAAEARQVLEREHRSIGVIMSDQRMPGETGVQLLSEARNLYPYMVRILVTAYADIDSAIASVNSGAIYKYISKPWDLRELRVSLIRALEYHNLLKDKDHLLKEKLMSKKNMVVLNERRNFGLFAAGLQIQFKNPVRAINDFFSSMPKNAVVQEALPSEVYGSLNEIRYVERGQNIQKVYERIAPFLRASISPPAEGPIPLHDMLAQWCKTKSVEIGVAAEYVCDQVAPSIVVEEAHFYDMLNAFAKAFKSCAPEEVNLSFHLSLIADNHGKVMGAEVLISMLGEVDYAAYMAELFEPFSILGANSVEGKGEAGYDLMLGYLLAYHLGARVILQAQVPGLIIQLPEHSDIPLSGSFQISELFDDSFEYSLVDKTQH